jgi:hypothetical protein
VPTNITRESLSSEVLQAVVRANVTLNAQVVKMAIVPAGTEPVSGDFAVVSWIGSAATTRTAQKAAAAYAAGSWDIYVQVTDTEVPVLYAGRMLVT